MVVTPTLRGWTLLDAVDKFLIHHGRWLAKDRQHVDRNFSVAIDDFVAVIPDESPESFGELVTAMRAVKSAITEADKSGDLIGPDHAANARIEELREVRERKSPIPTKPIEPISKLVKLPGIRLEQIAKMYGLFDANKLARVDLIEREIRNPGSVIDPETQLPRDEIEGFTHPVEFPPSRIEADYDRSQVAKETANAEEIERERELQRKYSDSAPETLEELFALDGITMQQIAKMKKLTVQSVQDAHAAWLTRQEAKAEDDFLGDVEERDSLELAIRERDHQAVAAE